MRFYDNNLKKVKIGEIQISLQIKAPTSLISLKTDYDKKVVLHWSFLLRVQYAYRVFQKSRPIFIIKKTCLQNEFIFLISSITT